MFPDMLCVLMTALQCPGSKNARVSEGLLGAVIGEYVNGDEAACAT